MPPDERRYQVFVSSTFRDLKEERERVLQAVLEMKAFPAGMELFPSADDEQWEFIKHEIESSDYYVVIVAGMYGSLASDGQSYTEKEYDYAIELGKPTLGFLARDLDELKGSNLEKDPSRREKLELFRDKVSRGKLVKHYRNPDELKSQVMHALMNSFRLRPQEGWVRAKNSRRMEDLEEINALQRELLQLRARVAELEAGRDPTAGFGQGDDTVEWPVRLSDGSTEVDAGVIEKAPVPQFTFRTTWNELLSLSFPDGTPQTREYEVKDRLRQRIELESRALSADQAVWLDSEAARGVYLWSGAAAKILDSVRTQFLGLGLIEYEERLGRPFTVEFWFLTPKGRLQLMAVKGVRRS